MSYHDLLPTGTTSEEEADVPRKFTSKELAENINIEVDEEIGEAEKFLTMFKALDDVCELSGDDPIKWDAIEKIVTLMNLEYPDAEVMIEGDFKMDGLEVVEQKTISVVIPSKEEE